MNRSGFQNINRRKEDSMKKTRLLSVILLLTASFVLLSYQPALSAERIVKLSIPGCT